MSWSVGDSTGVDATRLSISRAVFRPELGHFVLEYGGHLCRLKESKGLRYLCVLLAHPHTPVLPLKLVAIESRVPLVASDAGGERAAAERARLNVFRTVSSAMRRIKLHHPQLWRHLTHTVRVGVSCSYMPDAHLPIWWDT